MRLMIVCFAVLLAATAAHAEPLRTGLTPGNFGQQYQETVGAFDQKAIGALSLSKEISKVKCVEGVRAVCQYNVTGEIGFLIAGKKKDEPADSVILVLGKGSEALAFIINIGVMIMVVDPGLSDEDRGEVISNTIVQITKNKSEKETTVRNGVTYTAVSSNVLGVWFNAKRK